MTGVWLAVLASFVLAVVFGLASDMTYSERYAVKGGLLGAAFVFTLTGIVLLVLYADELVAA